MKKKIIIDVATIYAGKGGAGGGIWSYAQNLLLHLDKQAGHHPDLEFICLVNTAFHLPLHHLKVRVLKANFQNFLIRFLYIHLYLPLFAFLKRGLLHKLYFEAPLYCPVKMLVTIHDCMGDFYKKNYTASLTGGQKLKAFYFNWMNRNAIRSADVICTPSRFIKSELVTHYGLLPEKVVATPLATTAPQRQVKREKPARSALHLYCVAAFHRHKGQLRLIQIFESLCQQYNVDAHLFFRGHVHDAGYFEEVEKRIAESGVSSRIHLLQYSPQATLADIYADADWMVLLSEYEGFGLPVIEAQAYRTPVICSDIPTFKEVADDSAFYLKREWSIATTAQKLYAVLTDEGGRIALIERGTANVGRYSWDTFASQMLEVYTRMTAGELPAATSDRKESAETAGH